MMEELIDRINQNRKQIKVNSRIRDKEIFKIRSFKNELIKSLENQEKELKYKLRKKTYKLNRALSQKIKLDKRLLFENINLTDDYTDYENYIDYKLNWRFISNDEVRESLILGGLRNVKIYNYIFKFLNFKFFLLKTELLKFTNKFNESFEMVYAPETSPITPDV